MSNSKRNSVRPRDKKEKKLTVEEQLLDKYAKVITRHPDEEGNILQVYYKIIVLYIEENYYICHRIN